MPGASPADQRAPVASERPHQRGLRAAVVAFHHRNFTLFWLGALVSNIGTWMQNLTVPFALLYVMNTSSVWVGIATISQFLPSVILGPIAGWLADRFERKRVLLISQLVQLLLALLLWGAWQTGLRSPTAFVGLVALSGAVFGVTAASWQAFVSELVPREDLLNAITLNSAQFNGSRAIGPALAGLVLARFGPGSAFLANAFSFVAVIIALLFVRLAATERAQHHEPLLEQFVEGARYARRHTGITVAISVITLVGLFALPVSQMATVVAKQVYKLSPGKFGVLTAAYGVGAIIGALLLGALAGSVRRSRLVLLAVSGFAISVALFGLAPSFVPGIAALVLCGISFIATGASLNTSIQLLVGEHIRGRVLSLFIMAFTLAFPVGVLIQTTLADRFGPRPVLVGAAALLGCVAVALAVRPAWLLALEEHTHRDGLLEPLAPVVSLPPAGI
ncbi:MAG: hypothetical protein QOG64_2580 [Acidimicrobiaceae bacterium]|nr:hypothetical protein [Acidimicrobiaceae bacterium]